MRRVMFALVATGALLSSVMHGQTPAPQNTNPVPQSAARFDEVVRESFFAGLRGDAAALDRAMKLCEERLTAHPKDPAAMVWQGAGRYYLAGRAFAAGDFAKGMQLNGQGLSEMDEAVELDPTVQTLIPRGAMLMAASKHLPDPGERAATLKKGVADFERVLEQSGERFAELCVHDRGELLSGLAEGWYRLGDQRRSDAYLKRIVAELPNTRYSRTAATVIRDHPAAEKVSLTCQGCHIANTP